MTTPSSVTITNALVFDGTSAELTEGSITIADGVVQDIGRPAPGGRTIDAAGRVVVPGLIDAHFHAYAISLEGMRNERAPLSYSALAGARRLRSALSRGFTTVRDVAGGDIGLSNAVREGLAVSPRYLFTGPALSQTGGHGDPRSADVDVCFGHGHVCEIVDGVDNLRTAVRERFRTGSHAIKVMASGGVMSLTDPLRLPQYSAEEIRAVTDEAGRRGSYVAAHAYSPEAIQHAVYNGVRSIEHGNLLDSETAQLMAKRDSFLVPTLVAADAMERRGAESGLNAVSQGKNAELLTAGKEALSLAHAMGVNIGFGSDLMGSLEDDQLLGVRLQMEVLGVLQALRSMTSVNADLLQDPTLGRLTPGSVGDAVILDGNPFDDPAALWDKTRPRVVVMAGATDLQ